MSKIIDRTGKGSAIDQAEFDANYDSLHGINQVVSGTTHTVDITDQGDTIEFTNAGAVAVTLDAIATIQSAAHTSDFLVTLINTGAGTVTITLDATNTTNTGASTIVLETGEYVTIQTDSTELIWNIINAPILGLTASAAELNILDGVTSTTAELNILDGVTSTATELNIVDGDTADSGITVASGDLLVVNDSGTMVQTDVDDLDTYYSQTTKTLTNKTLTSPALTTPTVNGKPGYGLVVLDDPEQLVAPSANTGTLTYDMSAGGTEAAAAATAGATKAILRLWIIGTGSGGVGSGSIYIHKDTQVETPPQTCCFAKGANGDAYASTSEVTINLDSNSDFQYEVKWVNSATTQAYIHLVGYYV
jgi:hypothetical protein